MLFNNVPLRTRRGLLLWKSTVKPRPEAHVDMILFWSVFEEHRLDSTTTDVTMALFILQIMSLYYLILWNQVDILQKHFKKDRVHMHLWTRFYGMAVAPFWFSTEHCSAAITPFWFSADDMPKRKSVCCWKEWHHGSVFVTLVLWSGCTDVTLPSNMASDCADWPGYPGQSRAPCARSSCAWTTNGGVHGETVTHNDVKRCLHKWILIAVAIEAAMLEGSMTSLEITLYEGVLSLCTVCTCRLSTSSLILTNTFIVP